MSLARRESRSALRASIRSSSSSSAMRMVMGFRAESNTGVGGVVGYEVGSGRRAVGVLLDRQREGERSAGAGRPGRRDRAVVALDDLPAEREADAGAGILVTRV